jgi:hypothetical protein
MQLHKDTQVHTYTDTNRVERRLAESAASHRLSPVDWLVCLSVNVAMVSVVKSMHVCMCIYVYVCTLACMSLCKRGHGVSSKFYARVYVCKCVCVYMGYANVAIVLVVESMHVCMCVNVYVSTLAMQT